jgi:hypothetical protein
MKNIFKKVIVASIIVVFASCTKEDGLVVTSSEFQLRATTLNSPLVLNQSDDNNVVCVLEWDKNITSLPTVSTYTVQVSAMGSYSAEYAANNGSNVSGDLRTYTLKVGEINQLANKLPSYICGQEISVDVRIKAKVGTSDNAIIQYSNPVTLTVTPYPTIQPLLAFSTSSSVSGDSPKIASTDYKTLTDYEGFLYLEPGTYKLYRPNGCNEFSSPMVYGLNGTNTGSLLLDGSNGYEVTTAGFYLVKANLIAGTYSISKFTTIGIFGTATGLVSFVNTPMTYDAVDKKFKLTFDLLKGKKFRFKLLNGNVAASPLVVLGGTPDNCVANGADVTVAGVATDVPDTQKYDIVLDVNKPRKYTYTLTINPN